VNEELLKDLKKPTEMENRILNGSLPVLSYYVKDQGSNQMDKDIVIAKGQLMGLFCQPRYVDFPDHTHNYVELVYMYSGTTTHIINGHIKLKLETNDLLFLKQGTSHSIEAAGHDDIAAHFLVLPEFFQHPSMMMEDGSVLRRFITGAMVHNDKVADYLHFHLQGMVPAQNLLENMMWSLVRRERGGQSINQATMGILIMELLNNTDKVDLYDTAQYEEHIIMTAYQYLEDHYPTATLEEFSKMVSEPTYYISRLFKRYAKITFKECLQMIRLARAAFMLTATVKPVEAIISEVGYENSSYFHKLFRGKYGMTPKCYRDKAKSEI
jgi:AraC-like DNA-binding protein/quercetin dioxygenase-like cupin family protein